MFMNIDANNPRMITMTAKAMTVIMPLVGTMYEELVLANIIVPMRHTPVTRSNMGIRTPITPITREIIAKIRITEPFSVSPADRRVRPVSSPWSTAGMTNIEISATTSDKIAIIMPIIRKFLLLLGAP